MLIRHDTRYKLAALTAELWGRGRAADGVEGAAPAPPRRGPPPGRRVTPQAGGGVGFPTVFRRRPRHVDGLGHIDVVRS